jgi:hypothetical protein
MDVCAPTARPHTRAADCKSSQLFHVTFVNTNACKAAPGIKIKSEEVTCKVAGRPAGFCVRAGVPPGCKGEFIAINPERAVVSCWGGGPGGKTTAVTSVQLPTEVAGAAKAAAAKPATAAPAPTTKSGAAAAAVTAGAMVFAAAAVLMA